MAAAIATTLLLIPSCFMHTFTHSTATVSSRVTRVWSWLLVLVASTTLLTSVQAQQIVGPDQIFIDQSHNGAGPNTQYAARNGAGTNFNSAALGSYALATGANNASDKLILNGGEITTTEPTNPNARITAAQLIYRVFPLNNVGTTVFNYIDLAEGPMSENAGVITRQFIADNAGVDLIATVAAAGNYTLEVFLRVSYISGTTTTYLDDRYSGSINYQPNFTVTGARFNTTTWNGEVSDNWFDGANWDGGVVPNSTTNAYIKFPAPGSKASYPKIYANSRYQAPAKNPGTQDDYTGPTYNQNSGDPYSIASVNSLSFGGTSSGAANTELVTGPLLIYGDLVNTYDNFIQDAGTTVVFAGTNQSITGGSFKTVEIEGGGTKSLDGNMSIATALRFGSSFVSGSLKGIVATAPSNSAVILDQNGTVAATIQGEDNVGYVQGTVSTRVLAQRGSEQTFGNIGLSLTFSGANDPGFVTVKRVTGTYFAAGANSASGVSIKRYFNVIPDVLSTDNNPLIATVVFRYLDIERMNLGQQNNITISESPNVLTLFRSATGTSFTKLGYTSRDASANTVTTEGVTDFNILTLGDETTPLPVSLVAFNAQRLGTNGILTWATAMERNNKGFSVEVSTDGINFRALSFVASNSLNSDKRLSYSFTDTETSKTGVRYYRLRQLDTDGTQDFSPVRVLDFNSVAREVATALTVYPNPYGPSDAVKLMLQTTSVGTARLRVSDLLGREVANQTFTTVNGATEVALDQAAKLSMGTYMAQVTLPSGEVKTIRIQKR
jgi:hypothetical protein